MKLLNEDPEMVPKEALLIVLDSKSGMCMANNGKKYQRYQTHCEENKFCEEWRKLEDAQN